jgi:GNAT superfamily N-acetyltransferase
VTNDSLSALDEVGPAVVSWHGWPEDPVFLCALRQSWTAQYADYLGDLQAAALVDQLIDDDLLYPQQNQTVCLANMDGRTVGLAGSRALSGIHLVTMLEVLESHRSLGVGRQLLDCLRKPPDRQLAHVSIHRPGVRSFYERLGFIALERCVVDHYGHALEFDVLVR